MVYSLGTGFADLTLYQELRAAEEPRLETFYTKSIFFAGASVWMALRSTTRWLVQFLRIASLGNAL